MHAGVAVRAAAAAAAAAAAGPVTTKQINAIIPAGPSLCGNDLET
jgi:hypothetical protein